MKLTIEFEGTDEQIDKIASYISSSGIEDKFFDLFADNPTLFKETYPDFDYKQCFPAWGYTGGDKKIVVKMAERN